MPAVSPMNQRVIVSISCFSACRHPDPAPVEAGETCRARSESPFVVLLVLGFFLLRLTRQQVAELQRQFELLLVAE